MTAERFDGNTALQMSLVHETVEEQQLDKKIEQLVCSVLNNGPEAVAAAKQLISTVSGKAIDSTLIEHTCEVIADIRVSAQGQEGLGAFLEKRKPNWLKD
jgi:methylglutaconyl-CoA hydratase